VVGLRRIRLLPSGPCARVARPRAITWRLRGVFVTSERPSQVDYTALWDRVVAGFREVCDAYPGIKVSLEYKPTDENTRFFAVPSTGAAVLLVKDIDRKNMGLTLDFGHCLAAGSCLSSQSP